MEKPSSRFEELQWNVEAKTVNILEYAEFSYNFRRLHETICLRHFTISILIFCAGLWAVYQNSIFTAAALLGLAIACLLSSIRNQLLAEVMNMNNLMAMLINKQSEDLQSLRMEIMSKGKE